ncbi:NAD(+) diphosphatase [Propionicicella superfundia]|uniref:NAD(+) diphosphatase n=1 Tax=Propionicicella superfundia TaxID=348582 RepID=UPI00146D6D17|nr:NAD(+) diphosphatase [Propionicicella superfundia]
MEWWTSSRLDRVEPGRADESWIAALWTRPDGHLLRVDAEGDLAVAPGGDALEFVRPEGRFDTQRHLLLGLVDGEPYFVESSDLDLPAMSLKVVGTRLDDTMRDIATTAVALHNWHAAAPYCGVCGGYSEVRAGGHSRRCTRCGRERFPRTDPAMIVAVTDRADRLLLARPSVWVPRRMSLIAGFVEAGECLEQAVAREVSEEVGLHVRDVRYLSSQSWPFPRSLMVGFHAVADDPGFAVDGVEVEAAGWFSRAELDAAVTTGEVSLPGSLSIAYRIITAWRENRL